MIGREISHIEDFNIPKPLNKGIKDSADHTFVPVHMCFGVKFDLRRKAQMVERENMK